MPEGKLLIVRGMLLGAAVVVGLVGAVAWAGASSARSGSAASACSTPQPNRVLRVTHLTTTSNCAVARVLVRKVLGRAGCSLSYNDGFTASTCRFRISGRHWLCVSIAHLNAAHRASSYFDVGCVSDTGAFGVSTGFDLRGFAR